MRKCKRTHTKNNTINTTYQIWNSPFYVHQRLEALTLMRRCINAMSPLGKPLSDKDLYYTLLLRWLIWPRGYKTFFVLNSAEHEIFPANKSQITNNCKFFLAKYSSSMKTSLLINMTIVGIFIFISGEHFMLSWVKHEESFITRLGAWICTYTFL